jgi:hypothetical protein
LYFYLGTVTFKSLERDQPFFSNLRRLYFGGFAGLFEGDEISFQFLFSPVHMPRLVHLGICLPLRSDEHHTSLWPFFHRIFPQLEVLAISCMYHDDLRIWPGSILEDAPKLKHLSLDTDNDCHLRSLLGIGLPSKFDLTSLHLPSAGFDKEEEVSERLVALSEGGWAECRAERIVLYGKMKEDSATLLKSSTGCIEWREDKNHPPCEDFDGE